MEVEKRWQKLHLQQDRPEGIARANMRNVNGGVRSWRGCDGSKANTIRRRRSKASFLARLRRSLRLSARSNVTSPQSSTMCGGILTSAGFDARLQIGMALARYEWIARTATKHAVDHSRADGAKWARIAVRATEAKTQLLQDINQIDRTIGTLFIDDGKRADRIPSAVELQREFDAINVTDAELTSEAEWLEARRSVSVRSCGAGSARQRARRTGSESLMYTHAR